MYKCVERFNQLQAKDPDLTDYVIDSRTTHLLVQAVIPNAAQLTAKEAKQQYLQVLLQAIASNPYLKSLTIPGRELKAMIEYLATLSGSIAAPKPRERYTAPLSLVDIFSQSGSVVHMKVIGQLTSETLGQLCDCLDRLPNITQFSARLYNLKEDEKQIFRDWLAQNTTLVVLSSQKLLSDLVTTHNQRTTFAAMLAQNTQLYFPCITDRTSSSIQHISEVILQQQVQYNRFGQYEYAKQWYLQLLLVLQYYQIPMPIELLAAIFSFCQSFVITPAKLAIYEQREANTPRYLRLWGLATVPTVMAKQTIQRKTIADVAATLQPDEAILFTENCFYDTLHHKLVQYLFLHLNHTAAILLSNLEDRPLNDWELNRFMHHVTTYRATLTDLLTNNRQLSDCNSIKKFLKLVLDRNMHNKQRHLPVIFSWLSQLNNRQSLALTQANQSLPNLLLDHLTSPLTERMNTFYHLYAISSGEPRQNFNIREQSQIISDIPVLEFIAFEPARQVQLTQDVATTLHGIVQNVETNLHEKVDRQIEAFHSATNTVHNENNKRPAPEQGGSPKRQCR